MSKARKGTTAQDSLRLRMWCGGTHATYTSGKPKRRSETVVRDPCQGSCAVCHIERHRLFTALIVLHPLAINGA
jgi:hypothetical protein